MHKNINACVFYLGNIPDFGWLSLLTLSTQVSEIHVFNDAPQPQWIELENLYTHSITTQQLTSDFSKICKIRPKKPLTGYKLCDFKPFWPILAQQYLNRQDDVFITCDIDCLYGNIQHYLKPLISEDQPIFIGQCGHIQGANHIFLESLFDRLDCFFGNSWHHILESPKNFAFDEFKYLNRMLQDWTSKESTKLIWDESITRDAIDLNYWSLEPIDQRKGTICDIRWANGKNTATRIANNTAEIIHPSYIHFQKRPVKVEKIIQSTCLAFNTLHMNFSGLNGFTVAHEASLKQHDFSISDAMIWRLKMLRSRTSAKLSREAIWRC